MPWFSSSGDITFDRLRPIAPTSEELHFVGSDVAPMRTMLLAEAESVFGEAPQWNDHRNGGSPWGEG